MKGPARLADLKAMDYSVVQQCMHCGMCLPTCPTYEATKRERHSPRGRISLMRAIADDELEINQAFAEEMDYCLGCLACQSACPANVDYAQLFETARAASERHRPHKGIMRWFYRTLTLGILFRHPRGRRLVGRALRWTQTSGLQTWFLDSTFCQWLPKRWQRLMTMAPLISPKFSDELIARLESPTTETRYRVGFLTGCIQDLAYASVNRDTVEVLLANGCEVLTPREQHCCGSIHGHNGEVTWAQEMARKNIDAFPLGRLDAIITNAGGCGSHLRHYARLLEDDPDYADRAQLWDTKVHDIHEWLMKIGMRTPEGAGRPIVATYHDSCHLCHGQGITSEPRALLCQVPGLQLRELAEATWCCGSAGVYSITQAATSDALLKRKIQHLLATKAEVVATANPGCDLQLQRGLKDAGSSMRLVAPVTLLAEAYRTELERKATDQPSGS